MFEDFEQSFHAWAALDAATAQYIAEQLENVYRLIRKGACVRSMLPATRERRRLS
jgi:hypothetical protein